MPPAPTPWAITRSAPACAAATASSLNPTCQLTSAPSAWTVATSAGSGQPQKNSTSRARRAARAKQPGSMFSISSGATMKLTLKGREVSAWTWSMRRSRLGSQRAVPSMPSPPTFETAAASSGDEAAPIPACWIGTAQPTSSVKRVVSIVASLERRGAQPA